MRKALLIAGAAALAAGAPALAKPGGGGGGGKPEKHHGGGGKPEKHHGGGGGQGGGGGPHTFGGGGGGGHGGGKAHRLERGGGGGGHARQVDREQRRTERAFARQDRRRDRAHPARAERDWARAERKAGRGYGKAEQKAERGYARAERKAWKAEEKRFARAPRGDVLPVRYEDRRLDGSRHVAGNTACPPGLARKGNGCLPPGQARKLLAVGQALPVAYYSSYNVPDEYRDWYYDNPHSYYRYDESAGIYQVARGSGLIESLIPLLGGSFGIGEVLPAGYDAYNLPLSYRDDFADSDDALYRYGDDAIYQVDPQSQMIEGIVALLSGDLNVGQALPSGYDAYNLPMEYRDEYVDDADSMYRYADGNIYEVDPQSMIIEQIVAQLT